MTFKRIGGLRLSGILGVILTAVLAVNTLAGCRQFNSLKKAQASSSSGVTENTLKEDGITQMVKSFQSSENLPPILTVAHFEAELTKNAEFNKITLNLYGYAKDKKYLGIYSFNYSAADGKISYTPPDETTTAAGTPISYNDNAELNYLSDQIKKLPLKDQISKLNYPRYILQYSYLSKLSEGEPLIDADSSGNFPVASFDDYKKGAYGKSDGHTSVFFTLFDGTSMTSRNLVYYRCKPANTSTLYGDKNFTMQCDYRIIGSEFSFTRDYGETWINSGLKADELKETLNYYRSDTTIPQGSYFISPDESLPIAYFYGSAPSLRISKDNGSSFSEASFRNNLERDITKRIVGFTSKSEGYAALGTDWSMGAGEDKTCYLTHDGGTTWVKKTLPLSGTSKTLQGISFSDKTNGVVCLKSVSDESWPTLYATSNGANSWSKIDLPWNDIPKEIDFLSTVNSLTFENGTYTLILSQDSSGKRVSFKSISLMSGWKFDKAFTEVTHSVG